jgi:L-ribulose-5-phosphate 4-epimerase
VPLTRLLTVDEIRGDYEASTGKVIVERFTSLDPEEFPGVLVADHGPFSFGPDAAAAVENAAVLEHIAQLASETIRVNTYPNPTQPELLDRHFLRKHGRDAYYGQ